MRRCADAHRDALSSSSWKEKPGAGSAAAIPPHSTVSLVVDLTLAAWALLELGVRVRESVQGKGGRRRDRGTRILVALTLGAAIGTAAAAPSAQPLPTLAPLLAAGIVVMWLGLALRVWAIAALGGDFRTTVEVEPGQAVVSTGPYRWVRHPSYTGLLLIAAGLGVARSAWVSLAPAATSSGTAG
jgi:protein-S-isoprenylcysteine O-methyltransferase Ste14